MHIWLVAHHFGVLLLLFSSVFVPPMLFGIWESGNAWQSFATAGTVVFGVGLALWLSTRRLIRTNVYLSLRDSFLLTVLFWIGLSCFGALPFILLVDLQLSITDAVFESLSGLTTTGATVIVGLDLLPRSILFYRNLLQWIGGIGLVVIAVAILPLLKIGGMQMYRTEVPGPTKDAKLTPRIADTAKFLFLIYCVFTFLCAIAYRICGMSWFDAVCHAFSTISIGGFSTHDASFGYFDNPLILLVGCFFMVVAGINFSLHFFAWKRKRITRYLSDMECMTFLGILLAIATITMTTLYFRNVLPLDSSILHGLFNSISLATTTGFTSTPMAGWPNFLPIFLLMMASIGACSGSTGGGIKVIRVQILLLFALRELRQLLHPGSVWGLTVGRHPISTRMAFGTLSFFAVYALAFLALLLALLVTDMDFSSSVFAVIATLNNLGPGWGVVAENYREIDNVHKWVLCLSMLLGRLEVFTLLVILMPGFWRR